MQRYEIGGERDMNEFKVGDRVHVSNGGCTFSAYKDFFKENGLEFYKQSWAEGETAPVGDYTIAATGKHYRNYYSTLYLLRSGDRKIYIAHNDSSFLTLVEKEESKVIYASELMELARKNPEKCEGKRYKVVTGSRMYNSGTRLRYSECEVKHGRLNSSDGYLVMIYADTLLEEIPPEPKPVTFMEAVEAYEKGSTVECTAGSCAYTYEKSGDENKYQPMHEQGDSTPVSVEEILRGKWFIARKEG
jgi:hypothetical protein